MLHKPAKPLRNQLKYKVKSTSNNSKGIKSILDKYAEIAKLSEQWIEILDQSGEQTALEFYFAQITPLLVPVLQRDFKKTYGHLPKHDGLISLLGFTPETVILAYQAIRPETLIILHTKETEHLLDTVFLHTKIPLAQFFHESFQEKPHTDIYRALEAALDKFPKGSRVAIELTGGKKTMSGALAVAAGVLNIDLLYIDYTQYLPKIRKPRPESTYIHLVGNPLKLPIDLFSQVEMAHAVSFFNVGKFDISQTLFEQAANRMATPRVAEVCADLSKLYSFWNAFAFQETLLLSSSLFERILRFYSQIVTILEFDMDLFRNQMQNISKMAFGDRLSLLWNFFFSAERYEKNGQNDIAALLYYRTIESVFENALKDCSENFNTEQPDYSLLGKNVEDILTNFIKYRKKTIKTDSNTPTSLPAQVAMFDALCLLGAINHSIANEIKGGRVMNIAKIRNRSIYAHGVQPIDMQSVKDIRKLATDTLNAYIKSKNLSSIEDQRLGYEFMELVPKNKK